MIYAIVLAVVVGTDGKPRSLWVVLPLGEGLDENAIAAARQLIFTPATKDGKPVPVLINLVFRPHARGYLDNSIHHFRWILAGRGLVPGVFDHRNRLISGEDKVHSP